MFRRSAGWVGFLGAALAAGVASAGPEALLPRTWAEGVTWEAQPVRLSSPDAVRPVEPFVPATASEASGEVRVSAKQAAVVWLGALDVLRVHARSGTPRFERVPLATDANAAWVRLEEPGVPARAGLWYLAEPMGPGSLWVITAGSGEATVEIDRPAAYARSLSDEAVRAGLLAWIDGAGARPPLPFHPELRHQLDRDAELAELLLQNAAGEPRFVEALKAWRKASALRGWTLVQPLQASTSRLIPHLPQGEQVDVEGSKQPFAHPTGENGRWELTLKGPGVFALDVRRVYRSGGEPDAAVEVYEDGKLLGGASAAARISYAELAGLPLPNARTRRTTSEGAQLGPAEQIRIPLGRGKHTYRVEWRGGAVALRGREVHRRPWLSERLDGASDWSEWAEQVAQMLQGSTRPESVLLQRELARMDPRLHAPALNVPLETLTPALRPVAAIGSVSLGASADGAWDSLARLLSEAPLRTDGALAWSLRLELADQLIAAQRFDDARALMRSAPSFPASGWLAASAARRVAKLPSEAGLRSRELAALELAWRKEPLAPSIRAEYTRRFYDSARWRSSAPRGKEERPAVRRWLDLTPVADGAEAGSGALTALSPGQQQRFTVTEDEAPKLLRVYVLGDPSAKTPLVVRVDDQRFPIRPVEALEPVEVALPQGNHVLSLEGPASTRAFASLGGAVSGGEAAYARAGWALEAGKSPVRFRISDGQLPTPVRLQLRPGAALEKPVALWLRTDVGEARRLVLFPGKASAASRSIDEGGAESFSTASVTLNLPPLVREVWLAPDQNQDSALLFASVSVRATDGARRRPDAPASLDPAIAEKLLQLSRELERAPDDADRLLERARLLLTAGEEGLARTDVDRALELPQPLTEAQAHLAMAQLDVLDAEEDERLPFAAEVKQPTLLRPALGALVRDGTVADGAPGTPVSRYLVARELVRAGKLDEAALAMAALYRDVKAPQLAVETLALIDRTRGDSKAWRGGLAAIGYGVATQAATWAELPLVRRLRTETARWTRWDRLADAEQQAGSLEAQQDAPPEELSAAVRKALLAPPWALSEGRVVRAGNASVLDVNLTQADALGAEILCRTWPSAGEASQGPCRVTLRVDGAAAVEKKIPHGQVIRMAADISQPGKHQLELMVEDGESPRAAVIRFLRFRPDAEPEALESRRPLSFMRSSPALPVTLTVLGPTALRIGARSLGPDAPRVLRVATTREGGEPTGVELALPAQADATVFGTPLPVSSETETVLLLPERGAHQVRLESAGGDVLVRVRAASPERPSMPTASSAPELRRAEPLPWPALPERLSLLPDASRDLAPNRWGTFSAELAMRDERFTEGDELERPLRTGAEGRISFRRELAPEAWWLRAAASSRVFLDRAPAFGAALAVHGRQLPGELRFAAAAEGAFQSLDGSARYSLSGRALVDRAFGLTPDLLFIPSLAVDVWQSQGSGDPDRYDLSVYWRYGEDHPLRVTPRTSLRWQPFQDQLGGISAWATSNSDLRSLDNVTGDLHWASLWTTPLSPLRTEVGYGLSYRFADAHRSDAYLRHHLRAAGDWTAWSSASGRLLLFVEDRVFFSQPFGLQNLIGAGIRWDFTNGRGLRDMSPVEEEFDHLLDPRRSVD